MWAIYSNSFFSFNKIRKAVCLHLFFCIWTLKFMKNNSQPLSDSKKSPYKCFSWDALFFTLTTSLTYWEDFTCLDASQCLLNKSILHVAAKHLESDISGCLSQFLSLGTKVYMFSPPSFYLLCVCALVKMHVSVS